MRSILQLCLFAVATGKTLRGPGPRKLADELAGCEKVDVVDIVCHIAMLMEACAFMQKDINMLRWLILISQMGSAVYTILDTQFNWLDCNFIWAILHSSINGMMLFHAWKERVLLRNSMNAEEWGLWEKHFSIFNLNEFKVIKDQWQRVHQDEGEVIIEAGEDVTHVALVVEGTCSVVDKTIEVMHIIHSSFKRLYLYFCTSIYRSNK